LHKQIYPEDGDPDLGAKGNYVVHRNVMVVPLYNTGADEVAPMGANNTRAGKFGRLIIIAISRFR
jgi:hypothetical protein